MSELPAHRSHRAAASSSSHSPSKLPSALHLPSIDSWSSLYDRLPPLSFSPMRESSPPLSPHSVGERRSYAYIRGSSPRLSPGGYHYPSDVNYCAYQDPYLGGKFALPGIRTVFGEDNYDHHRHHHGIPSEFDASESSEDAESSPQSDPLDRLHQPTTSTSTSMFDSEEEQEEDDEEGLSFRETGLRATFFRTSAERGQWRADPILPYQQSLLLQMRKSEPVPSPTATTIENSLGGIQRRISEPALITSKDTFLPADPSDGHESEVSCDPQLSSVGSALAGGCISAALGSSDKGRYPSSAAESSPIVDTRPALPPSSPLPALTPEMSPDVLPESESEATEPPASSEPSEEISEPSDVLEEGEKMVDEVIADAVMEAGVEVEMSAEDLAMETRAVSPLPPSSPFPPSSPMLEVVSSIPVSPALVPDPQLEENDLERELQIAPQPEENDILPEIVPAPQPEENDYEVEPVLEQDLQAGETDLESETRALSPAPSLRSLSPLSFAPSSPVAPSSPLSIISSVDDDDFASYEGSSSAGELPSVSPIDVVKTWVEDSASSIRPAGSKKNEVKAQASSSVVPVVVKEKPKPKPKFKRKSEDGEEQAGKRRKISAEVEKEKGKEKARAEKGPVKKSRKGKSKAKAVEEVEEMVEAKASSSSSTSAKSDSKLKRSREEDTEDSKTTESKPKPKKRKAAPTSIPRPTVTIVDPLSDAELELQGLLIESMALSRASSMTISVLYKTVIQARPAMKEEKTLKEWVGVFERVLKAGWQEGAGMFGRVESSGKDDSEKPLEARWFYVPEQDADQERATLLRSMMPRPGKRSETKKYKQYYWRPLDKISRWDPEDDL